MTTTYYYPEMKEAKPEAQIEAKLAYGGGYRLTTPLELKGRGIKFYDTYNESNCTSPKYYGLNIYYATEKAFEKLEAQYTISFELLLD